MVLVEGKDARIEGDIESLALGWGWGGGGQENTYQRGHPLKEVDALSIIDVVCLPALRVTGGKRYSQSGVCPPPDPLFYGSQKLFQPSCPPKQFWEETWATT